MLSVTLVWKGGVVEGETTVYFFASPRLWLTMPSGPQPTSELISASVHASLTEEISSLLFASTPPHVMTKKL